MTGRATAAIVAGALISTDLAILALIGPSIAPFEVTDAEKLVYRETDHGIDLFVSPDRPSARHPFGTDEWGYDVLTLMLHGARYTVFGTVLIAALRVLLGGMVGLQIGLGAARSRKTGGLSALNSLPVFVVLLFLLRGINNNPPLAPAAMAALQGVMIAVLGIPRIVTVVRSRTHHVLEEPFVEAARAAGAGRSHLLRRHVFPFVKDTVLVEFAHELVAVLTLVGILGIFSIYFGGTRMTVRPVMSHSITHEWGGLANQNYLTDDDLHDPAWGGLSVRALACKVRKAFISQAPTYHVVN